MRRNEEIKGARISKLGSQDGMMTMQQDKEEKRDTNSDNPQDAMCMNSGDGMAPCIHKVYTRHQLYVGRWFIFEGA